jgi:hypothetical protein
MTERPTIPQIAALRKLEAIVHLHHDGSAGRAKRAGRAGGRQSAPPPRRFGLRSRALRRTLIGIGLVGLAAVLGCAGLWWRLSDGPISFEIATPWLTAAIEENFGASRSVEVGGTQIERTENGRTAVRIRDIVVRDTDGTIVASAPKAEVGVSGAGLLSGHLRAESLNLVGAEMAVRIKPDGDVTVFAGGNKRPIATASVPAEAAPGGAAANQRIASSAAPPELGAPATVPAPGLPAAKPRKPADVFAALLSWIDGIGQTGLDGHDLREIGLKSGNLTVDDERTGKRWTFENISLSLERPSGGGVVVSVGSDNRERPWALTASIVPTGDGKRSIELEGRKVSANDLLLALRLGDGNLQANLPLSVSMRGEIGPDGVPQELTGRIVAEGGTISDASDPSGDIPVEHAEFKLNWDAANRILSMPFQILSAGNRITLLGQVEAPRETGGVWAFGISGGTVLLAPAVKGDRNPLILNRVAVRGRFDPLKKRFDIDQGDIGNMDLGVALSGNIDFSGDDPRVAAGIAGTRMSVAALKRLWPVVVAPKVRTWVNDHLVSGTVERMVIAVNAPFNTLKESGPPVPDDGLSLEAVTTGTVVRPVEGLPAIRDADLNVHIVGRNATVMLGKGTADLPSGRKLTMTNGLFEVPDTAPHEPPARVRFKLDGPVAAAAELLATDRLRDASGAPFDPASTKGTMTAQVALAMPLKPDLPPGSTNYAITVDATNFAADRMVMGQKVEAATLRVTANNQGFQLKGDVKIGGTPASLEYHKPHGDGDAEVRIQATLDQAARANLGFDNASEVGGAIPIRLAGRIASTGDHEGRFAVEADLTSAEIDGLLPGWVKPVGKPARATFTLATKPQSVHVEDLVIEGAGGGVKGTLDFDDGTLQAANFSSYGFSDGDKATLKAERGQDGTLRVTMRGDVYDARGFVKTTTGGSSDQNTKSQMMDIDLDIKLGAVVGFNGEALRSLDLRLSRRAGQIRTFGMNAKIGRDSVLVGDLRGRAGGRQVIYLETSDAGSLFRFSDIYARMNGGQMWVAMDPPAPGVTARDGILNVRDFAVRGEAQLERAVAGPPDAANNGVQFSRMRVDFTRSPGKVALRDGVVRGPIIGATIDGQIDYARDEVRLRGTLVPLYGPNNLLGQLPLVGPFLGGDKEGLVGITYEVVGRPGQPVLRVNPISALAPGMLRKVFEFPANTDTRVDETRSFGRP